jgi:hypothetical protein
MKYNSKLRVIDHGTRYDISGKLRAIVRRIETGELTPRDVVVVTRALPIEQPGGKVELWHLGTGTIADVHWMLRTAQNRIEPS